MDLATAFLLGVLFALGLGLGGMTRPAKVIGFLDVTGRWDPTLLFVMTGAVLVGALLFPHILRRSAPLLCGRFVLPEATGIDARLLVGAGLFGVGWGLSGYCPGPAIVSVATGAPAVLVFVLSMLAGLHLGGRLSGTAPVSSQRVAIGSGSSRSPGDASAHAGCAG